MYSGGIRTPGHVVAGGTATATATASTLPYTGAAVLLTVVLGAAMIAAGLLVLGALKRRQQG